MLTVATSAFFCSAPKTIGRNENIKTYQRETLQKIASVVDIIVGFGLIATGFALNMPN